MIRAVRLGIVADVEVQTAVRGDHHELMRYDVIANRYRNDRHDEGH